MKASKKAKKEEKIIRSAEKVFSNLGYKNSKMEDIAEASGITKVTLYSYFQSKENLYMAITYHAMLSLNKFYIEICKKHKKDKGITSTLALIEGFMNFCEQYYLYSEALLDYFSLIRSGSSTFTDALKESVYFKKAQNIQNEAFKYVIAEIERGKEDGSISSELDSAVITLIGWTSGIGYAKVVSASGSRKTNILNVDLAEIKKIKISLARKLISNKISYN